MQRNWAGYLYLGAVQNKPPGCGRAEGTKANGLELSLKNIYEEIELQTGFPKFELCSKLCVLQESYGARC